MGDQVTLTTVATAFEADVICGILREQGIDCFAKPTNVAVGMGDGLATAGPREVVVLAEDVERAREVLQEQQQL